MGSDEAGVSSTRLVFADGLERTLDRDSLRIGRSPEMDVMLVSQFVSRQHAALVKRGGRWYLSDLSSANGTHVNGIRLRALFEVPLRHGDRVEIGGQTFTFSDPAQLGDPERTDVIDAAPSIQTLSPLQTQVLRLLCQPYLERGHDAQPPTNAQIAAALGTPHAAESVKAALKRIYIKAGIDSLPPPTKRRILCRIAHHRGWV